MSERDAADRTWYSGVTRYQWLVLVIASAGWMFDAFEGQVFNITRGQMLADLMGSESSTERVRMWGDTFLAIFLLGGTVGGLAFGSLADRYGRKWTLAFTILFYSIFSGLTYFATELWHVAVLRFLVALGVGGEWAVGATLVAEVFPARARARASGIFHATSVLGTWLAAAAGLAVGSQWRYAYIIGLLPALLVLWVRSSIHEPERWSAVARAEARGSERRRAGSFSELFGVARWARPAILGLLLAAVGLGTFWGVTVAGQDLTQALLVRNGMPQGQAAERAKFAFGIVQTAGGGLGLLCFGPLAERIGRRGAFALMHLMALVIVPVICYVPQTYGQMLCILAGLRVLHAGEPRGVCGLLSRALSRSPARHRDERMLQRWPAGGGADPVVIRHAQRPARNGPSSCRSDAELVVSGGPRSADLPAGDEREAASRIGGLE